MLVGRDHGARGVDCGMNIDWRGKANADSVGETASVLLRSRRGGGLESAFKATVTADAAGAGGAGTSERERLDRLAEALAIAQPAVPKGEQAGIKREVLAGALSGLAKVYEGEAPKSFTLGEHIGLEAVILTNGERPSLFVRNGFVDLNAADIGDWDQDLGHFQNEIRKVIMSVGRIDVPVKPWFAGTCIVIAEGLVVTNRHVLEEIATQDAAGAWTLKWPDATSVDFVGEDGAAAATKFKVSGVPFAGLDPINRRINFAHLDMAILRLDPDSDAANTFPMPVTFETDTSQPKSRRDLYVVGFPGQPKAWLFDGAPPAGYETTQVISTVFNDKFGVKRLAPGTIKAGPGEVANDGKSWICTHDASTLGGNSGSCVADLSGDGFRIMALHFAGTNRERNWAHVAARLHEQLSTFSATFVP
jgi:hypothetical protein